MNRQDTKPGRGIEWTSVYGMPGYTANPIKGCKHACRWRMPNGDVAVCYAETIAERLAVKSYPGGFANLQFDERELAAIRKLPRPAGIFIDSMSDMVGAGVPSEWIEQVIQTMRDCPQHIFLILTKNPPRLKQFTWPENAWIGVSAPPTFMFGKELTLEQQQRWYSHAFDVLATLDIPVRWTSIEPLSWNVAPILEQHFHAFEWAVIGAASNGAATFQPDEKLFKRAYRAMGGKPVFLKGNISRTLAQAVCGRWVEEFPMVVSDWRQRRIADAVGGAE